MAEFNLTGQELFGRYARIAYGHALSGKQDYHIYKCIQTFRSNYYCDVPLTYQTENNCYDHTEIVDVVNVIHCGIDESRVIRVALKDIELIPTIEKKPIVHAHWIYGETIYGVEWMKCSACCKSQTPTGVFSYCPNCGAQMDEKEV